MQCRLCLREGVYGLQNVFNAAGKLIAEEIHKSIKTFLDIELHHNDEISTKICHICWKHLFDFNRFCKNVAEKQQQLKEQLESKKLSVVNAEVSVTGYVGEGFLIFDTNLEDTALCEQQIDINEATFHEAEVVESDDAFESSSFSSADSSSETKTHNTKPAKVYLTPRKPSRKKSYVKIPKKKLEMGLELDAALDVNINMHHGEEQATECSASSTEVHSNVTNIICNICGQVLLNKLGLDKHMRLRHQIGQTEFQCNICGKFWNTERSLHKHESIHKEKATNEKFLCPICGVENPTRTKLTNHIRYHHNEKDYICSFCSKQFKNKYLLDDHIATHSQKALYSCPFCSRTFKLRRYLHDHKKRVHPDQCGISNSGGRPHTCEFCSHTFKSLSCIQQHKRRFHPLHYVPLIKRPKKNETKGESVVHESA